MRSLSPGFAAHLASGTTTLCHCFRVKRDDGVVLGFTDHDRDIAFDGTLFGAGSGFAASAMGEESGLPAATTDVAGAFSSDLIREEDLLAGRYDGARVEVFRVNWANPAERLLLKVQEIGEVSRSDAEFRAELRPFTHRLQQAQGRIYSRSCGAVFGDAACGLALVDGEHVASATIAAVISETRLEVSGLAAFAEGAFTRGVLGFSGGVLEGITVDIDRHWKDGSLHRVDLWLPLAVLPVAGDSVRLTVGCDKSFATCRNRFGNGLNFQGFPHLPGSDFAYSYADSDSTHDGGAIFP